MKICAENRATRQHTELASKHERERRSQRGEGGGKFGSIVFAAFRSIDAFRSKRATLRYPVVPAAVGDFQFQDVLHKGTALRSELRSRSLLPKTTHVWTKNFSPLPY